MKVKSQAFSTPSSESAWTLLASMTRAAPAYTIIYHHHLPYLLVLRGLCIRATPNVQPPLATLVKRLLALIPTVATSVLATAVSACILATAAG